MQTSTMRWKWWGTTTKLKDNDIVGKVNVEKPMIHLNIIMKNLYKIVAILSSEIYCI